MEIELEQQQRETPSNAFEETLKKLPQYDWEIRGIDHVEASSFMCFRFHNRKLNVTIETQVPISQAIKLVKETVWDKWKSS